MIYAINSENFKNKIKEENNSLKKSSPCRMNDYKGRHKFFILAKPSKDKHTPRNLVEVGLLYKLSNKEKYLPTRMGL